MSSPFSLPESHTQYQYFAKFNPVAHYNAYHKVFNILMPGKHQMPQGSPLPGGQRFSISNVSNPMEDYLLQQALPVVYGPPFLMPKENTTFPSVVFTRFPTPSPDDDDEDDEAETSSPLRASPMTAANFFLASPVQATPTHPNLHNLMEGHPASPPADTGFQELARQMSWTVHPGSPHPVLPAVGSSRSFDFAAFTPMWFDPASLLCLPVPPQSASPLPPVEGQGDFNPLPVPMVIVTPSLPVIAVLEDSLAATPPVDELRSPSPPQIYHVLSREPLNTVEPSTPSSLCGPPAHLPKITGRKPKPCMLLKDGWRAYHCQLMPPPAPLSAVHFESTPSSAKSPNKRKRSSSGKGKAVQMAPAISLPSAPCTRAHAHSLKAAMLPPSPNVESEAEVEKVWATKKPKLSSFDAKPKKKSKAAPRKKAHFMARSPGSSSDSETGGVSITRDTTRAELKALTFDDIQTTPHEFLPYISSFVFCTVIHRSLRPPQSS
ncbi:hypothetical protein IW261DRAFT_1420616 [Armillaria novae-zelandiae]|uniref:Uncharacterized protein n=1 Tax=Armillaria novae-zelandiae TaxID=153914 RepID=A0AA39P6M1_9AGAR|nr:hypothetical protein IW261DRAFT_1420616 [Armillaria novae-zelandiae]